MLTVPNTVASEKFLVNTNLSKIAVSQSRLDLSRLIVESWIAIAHFAAKNAWVYQHSN